jgi:1-acyl-sn-glycerol-3-phosphate acyltransferase
MGWMSAYYGLAMWVIKIYHILFWQNCKAAGRLNLPPGGKIIAGNHPNATDGLFLPFLFREKLHFLIQGDIFDIPFIGWLLAKSDQIPVIAGQKKRALEQAARYLSHGATVVIFPEARLNPNHLPIKVATGAIRLSLITHVPIIPIGFYVPSRNLRHMSRQKNGRLSQGNWQFRGCCFLHIGEPWSPADEIAGHVDPNLLHELTDLLMEKIDAEATRAGQDCFQALGNGERGTFLYGD